MDTFGPFKAFGGAFIHVAQKAEHLRAEFKDVH